MADGTEIKVKGYDELARGSRTLADHIQAAAPDRFGLVAEQVAAAVSGSVPHVSGTLAGSVVVGQAEGGATVGIGEGVPYAGWIEFGGTRGRPYVAQGRYLFPTAQQAEAELVQAAEALADDEIGGMRWPTPT